MLQVFEFIAALCVALLAGAALYISLVEHPVRMGFETRVAALQWHRATSRHLDASALGPAELSERSGGVAHGRRHWMACGGRAHRGSGALHCDRHPTHELQALGAPPRSRV